MRLHRCRLYEMMPIFVSLLLPLVVSSTEIVIGQTGPLTGLVSVYGQPMKAGLSIAIDEANANGWLGDRTLRLVSLDDGYNETESVENFEELLNQHNMMIMAGTTGTPTVKALLPYILDHKVPFVGPLTGADITRTPFKKEIINIRTSYSAEIVAITKFLLHTKKLHRIACFYSDTSFGRAGYEPLKEILSTIEMSLVSTGVYKTTDLEVSIPKAIESITDTPPDGRPQAIVLAANQSPNAMFINLYKKHPNTDPDCIFLLWSVGATASIAEHVDSKYWKDLLLFQSLPLPSDNSEDITGHFANLTTSIHHHTQNMSHSDIDTYTLEGYMTGCLIVEVLRRNLDIPRSDLDAKQNRELFLDKLYNAYYPIHGLTLGPYTTNYAGCEQMICNCSTGLRSVFLAKLDDQGNRVPELDWDGYRFDSLDCEAPLQVICPTIFGQMYPDSGVWKVAGEEIGRGIQAAFDAINSRWDGNDHHTAKMFALVQAEYGTTSETNANATLAKMKHNYSLVSMIGNVLPSYDDLLSDRPSVAPYAYQLSTEDPTFDPIELHIQPSPKLEFQSLIVYALEKLQGPLHFIVPEGEQETLDLLSAILAAEGAGHQLESSSLYTKGGEALDSISSGVVIAVGQPGDVKLWYRQLEDKPDLYLMVPAYTALHVIIGNDIDFQSMDYSKRFFFPWMTRGNSNQSVLWQYGHLAAAAAIEAVLHAAAAINTCVTPDMFTYGWYLTSTLTALSAPDTHQTTTLGPYYETECTYQGDKTCSCNQGTRTMVMHNLLGPLKWAHESPSCLVSLKVLTKGFPVWGYILIAVGVCVLSIFMICLYKSGQRNNKKAPKDESRPFCILFTDIQNSTNLWATIPEVMAVALDTHHCIIRRLIRKHRCYEVKTIGDCFMCACSSPHHALEFSLELQRQFYDYDWGTDLIDKMYKKRQTPKYTKEDYIKSWSGLRVRVGIHYGYGQIVIDPVSKGYDYYGTVVNTAARIESVLHGGQIGVSKALYDYVGGKFAESIFSYLGPVNLRGLTEPIELYQVLPSQLPERKFPPLKVTPAEKEEAISTEAMGMYSHVSEDPKPHQHSLVQTPQRGSFQIEDLPRPGRLRLASLVDKMRAQTKKTSPQRVSSPQGSIGRQSSQARMRGAVNAVNAMHHVMRPAKAEVTLDTHELVKEGVISLSEIHVIFGNAMNTLCTLLSIQGNPNRIDQALKLLCCRLQVENLYTKGKDEESMRATIQGLVLRILPCIVKKHLDAQELQQLPRANTSSDSPTSRQSSLIPSIPLPLDSSSGRDGEKEKGGVRSVANMVCKTVNKEPDFSSLLPPNAPGSVRANFDDQAD